MKLKVLAAIMILGLACGTTEVAFGAVTPGTKCAKSGAVQIYKSKTYTCLKLGKYLYWSNGVAMAALPSPTPTKVNSNAGGRPLTWTYSPSPDVPKAPLQVSNLLASSYNSNGITLTFTFDLTDPLNADFSDLAIQVYSSVTNTYSPISNIPISSLSSTSSSQTLLITPYQLSTSGYSNLTHFTKIELATDAASYTLGFEETTLPLYQTSVIAPIITVTPSVASYSVNITNLSALEALGCPDVVIEEFISSDTLAQVQAEDSAHTSTWHQVGPPTTASPVQVLAIDSAHRWIRAYGEDIFGGKSPYSNYVYQ